MAVIRNTDSTVEIHFLLNKADEKEWINYQVAIYISNKGTLEKALLDNISLLNDNELFFDGFYEPELPIFKDGINKVLEGHSDFYYFSPADEKDFILEIKLANETENYLLSFFTDKNIANIWEGIRIIVSKNELAHFINNLVYESENLT